MQQLKQIEEKETGMWADNFDRHNKNNEQLSVYQARSVGQLESIGSRMIQMQKQIENLSFKNVELERNLTNLTKHNRDLLDNNMTALEVKQSANRDIGDVSSEMRLMKDRLLSQEDAKSRFFKDMQQQVDSLNAIVLKSEKDLYTRLREQKKELLEEAFGSKDQWKKLEEMRMEKIMGDNEYMKSLMDSLERKMKNEMGKRLSSDFDTKNWLEVQFHNFKDEIVSSCLILERRSKRHA